MFKCGKGCGDEGMRDGHAAFQRQSRGERCGSERVRDGQQARCGAVGVSGDGGGKGGRGKGRGADIRCQSLLGSNTPKPEIHMCEGGGGDGCRRT
eukprot:352529-Chlamydomonas_euryale.AAC.2